MLRKIGNKYYAYASKRIRDPRHPKGYRIVQEYLGCLGSRARKAQAKHDQIMQDRKDGNLQSRAGNADLLRYFEGYLKSNEYKSLAKPTQVLERNAITNFGVFLREYPHGVVRVNQATPAVIIDFQNWMIAENKKSNALTNRHVRIIKKLVKKGAKAKEDLTWEDLKSKTEYKGKTKVFQWDEVFKLLQIADFFWYGVACIGMFCGLRRTEMRHLTTFDISLREWEEEAWQDRPAIEDGKIVIRKEIKSVHRYGGTLSVCKKIKSQSNGISANWTPKDSEARDIEIPDWAAIWLEAAIKRARAMDTPYIFHVRDKKTGKGRIVSEQHLTNHFKDFALAQGVNKATPHRLRHTFGTSIGEISGAAMIMTTMGHSNLKTSTGYMGSRDQQPTMDKLQKAFEERASK